MPSTPTTIPPRSIAPLALWAAAASILVALLLAYANSFSGPFVFDDLLAIPQNPTLDHLSTAWSPPTGNGATVQGRPVLNLSFAMNRLLGGNAVGGYHAANLLIHSCAALLLLGIVRRTLLRRGVAEVPALGAAWACALLWAVHPLQTESVTYIVQRAESLMGLWYLLCLYGYVRWLDAKPSRRGWLAVSFFACLLGMATKEVMVSAPVILWLYDGIFVSDGLVEAWSLRWKVFAVFALGWIPLFWLVLGSGNRGGTSGFDVGVKVWTYWATEAVGVLTYAKLLIFPSPLVFDYGTQGVSPPLLAGLAALVLALLAAGCLMAVLGRGERLRRYGPAGFAGLCAAAVLATTSVIPGNRQALAEHRMYLPGAALLSLALCWLAARVLRPGRTAGVIGWIVGCVAVAAVFGSMTFARNADYRSVLVLFADTVAKAPNNAFARYNYARALDDANRVTEAIPQYVAAIRIAPDRVDSWYNLANDYASMGDAADAEPRYRQALLLKPDYALAHFNYGNLLHGAGRNPEAIEQYRAALAKYPDYTDARANLGGTLLEAGRTQEAEKELALAVAQAPGDLEAHYNLAMAYFLERRREPAVREFEAVLRLKPDFRPAIDRLRELAASP